MNKQCPKCGYPSGPENERVSSLEFFVQSKSTPGARLTGIVTGVIIGLLLLVVVTPIGN